MRPTAEQRQTGGDKRARLGVEVGGCATVSAFPARDLDLGSQSLLATQNTELASAGRAPTKTARLLFKLSPKLSPEGKTDNMLISRSSPSPLDYGGPTWPG